MKNTTCRICGGESIISTAFDNTFTSSDDFGNDAGQRGTTQSKNGPAKLIEVNKCKNCGHSWIPNN